MDFLFVYLITGFVLYVVAYLATPNAKVFVTELLRCVAFWPLFVLKSIIEAVRS